MATEIEYKFLINDLSAIEHLVPFKSEVVKQGYLTTEAATMVRVRISEFSDLKSKQWTEAWITVKGPAVGLSRSEYEYEIPLEDAEAMMKLCGTRLVQKDRYCFKHAAPGYGAQVIELDVFGGRLAGLVMAEIEVMSESEMVKFPEWFGKDVSRDFRYTNAALALMTDAEIESIILSS